MDEELHKLSQRISVLESENIENTNLIYELDTEIQMLKNDLKTISRKESND